MMRRQHCTDSPPPANEQPYVTLPKGDRYRVTAGGGLICGLPAVEARPERAEGERRRRLAGWAETKKDRCVDPVGASQGPRNKMRLVRDGRSAQVRPRPGTQRCADARHRVAVARRGPAAIRCQLAGAARRTAD